MTKRILALVMTIGIAPLWSALSLQQTLSKVTFDELMNGSVTIPELQMVMQILICFFAIWIWIELILVRGKSEKTSNSLESISTNKVRRWLIALLTVFASGHSHELQKTQLSDENSIPLQLALTPAIASLLIREVLVRRRQQIRHNQIPDVFTKEETWVMSRVQELAKRDDGITIANDVQLHHPIATEFLAAVDRIDDGITIKVDEDPLLVVHVYGYPVVTSRDGQRATFRKKRALELAVWLSLNRDRPRRSAARTALWQVDVSDATFSTIVSDMRRGLSEIEVSVDRSEILPATYSDELLLSQRILTDYDLLAHSLQEFRRDTSMHSKLAMHLRGIRDAPFSGTSYEWADLDGTTTRLIITALQASQELAEYALSVSDVDLMNTAVAAGLRVMPGHEELLRIQQSFIPVVSMSRSSKIC